MKRNLISLITAVSIICSIMPVFRISASAEDLTISTLAELEELSRSVNSGEDYSDKTIVLTADIDMSEKYGEGKSSWTPIGNSTNKFNGTFDGGGHTIKGLYINTDSSDNRGLFGYCTGTIKNISVRGFVAGKRYVGGVVGQLYGGSVENCNNSTVINASSSGGGIVGYAPASCTVTGCSNTADITVKGKAGGIVGNGKSIIKDCYNTGNITTISSVSIQDGAGGIVGWLLSEGCAENCFNKGNITLNGGSAKFKDYTGGIAGFNAGTISDCYNAGIVTTDDENVVAGGVTGDNSGSMTNCYNAGSVSGSGISGSNSGLVTDCYYLENTAENGTGSDDGSKEISSAEIARQSTFALWDFNNIWEMSDAIGRPVLKSIPEYKAAIFSGSGTSEMPYLIPNLAALEALVDAVNGGNTYEGKYFCVTADIDMYEKYGKGKSSWTPIGNSTNKFNGTFDGGGYTIRGLYIDTVDDYQGLFGCVTGTVKNISVSGSVTGENYTGGIVGQLDGGKAENCHNSAVINAGAAVGGIVGNTVNNASVINCSNTADIIAKDFIGGIIGCGECTVINCFNTGNIITVSNEENQASVGGITGCLAAGGRAEKCFNKGNVVMNEDSAEAKYNLGGIAGFNEGIISDCYNAGSVTTDEDEITAGGIAGRNSGTVQNCYSIGVVSGNGITGDNSGLVTGCYYLENTAENDSSAERISKVDFARELTFTEWDFSDIWEINEIFSRPMLKAIPENEIAIFCGNGTAESPYLISDLPTLEAFCSEVNGGNTYENEYFNVTADIDMSEKYGAEKQSWTPIGKYTNDMDKQTFAGTIDGSGHTISGIYIESTGYQQGLFGYNEGIIKNLSAEGFVSGKSYVGGLIGYNMGTVQNCHISVTVIGTDLCAGGVVGWNRNGTVERCYNTGSVSGSRNAGGVVGYNSNTISNCYNTGSVSGSEKVGGVSGLNESTVQNCYNVGTVSGSGVAGSNSGRVTGCYYLRDCADGGINGTDTDGAKAIRSEDFERESSFEYWDFIDIWGMCPSIGRPVLRDIPEGEVKEFKGAGTEGSPYLINDLETLEKLFVYINDGGGSDEYFKLTADIDMQNKYGADKKSWTPIGNITNKFNGTFDGGGYMISGLYMDTEFDYQGLFGCSSGTIKNLSIDGIVMGIEHVGIIAGLNNGTIERCYTAGTVSGNGNNGGVSGMNNGTVQNCYSMSTVSGNGNNGGVTGLNNGSVHNCYSIGMVSGGGIAGDNSGRVTDCYYLENTAQNGIGNSIGGAVEISKENFANKSTFLGWDFNDVWKMSDSIDRPILKSVPEDAVKVFEGEGTEENPYLIANLKTLENFRRYVNVGRGKDEYFILTADIDMSEKYREGKASWTPIGNDINKFNGVFNGGGHTISGLYTDEGLFGCNAGTIANIGIRGTVEGESFAGAVAGHNGGIIENCLIACAVSGENTGSITGDNNGIVRFCCNIGTAVSAAGQNKGNVTDCYYLSDEDDLQEKKTAEQFSSGEVAWLLQDSQQTQIWGQDITSLLPDDYPILTSNPDKKVMKVTFALQTNLSYSVFYTNSGGKVTPPPVPAIEDETLMFIKWSQTNSAEGETFTLETEVTGDITVYAIIGKKPVKAEGSGSIAMADYNCGVTNVNPIPSSSTNGTDSVTYQYKMKTAEDSAYTSDKPIKAGDYTVKAVFAETADYKAVTATADFTVSHNYSADWSSNSENHWYECVCGEKSDIAEHNYIYSAKDNVITGTCSDCGRYETAEVVIINNTASINYSSGWHGGELAVEYKKDGNVVTDISVPGTYTAFVTMIDTEIGEIMAQKQFTVASPSPSPTAKPKSHGSSVKATPLPTASPTPTSTHAPVSSDTPEVLKHTAYMIGNDDGTFNPDGNITRAEVTAIFARLTEGFDESGNYESDFPDVTQGLWYYKYIGFEEKRNIIAGYEDGTFRPENFITRAEFAALMAKHACLNVTDGINISFIDTNGHWAYKEIQMCYYNGYISGYDDGTFKPDNPITRAEAVKIINTYLGRGTDAEGLADVDYTSFPDVYTSHWAYYDIVEASNNHIFTKGTIPEIWIN